MYLSFLYDELAILVRKLKNLDFIQWIHGELISGLQRNFFCNLRDGLPSIDSSPPELTSLPMFGSDASVSQITTR
jgi:hypothetical protein